MPFFAALNEYTRKQVDLLSPAQPARLVILSSQGDWATRGTFPVARVFSTVLESYQDSRMTTPYGADIELSERHLDWQTMGNAEALQTHQPLRRTAPAPWDGKCPPARPDWLPRAIDERKAEQRQKGEKDRGVTTPSNPLWILAVDTALIPSHSGFANPEGEKQEQRLRRGR